MHVGEPRVQYPAQWEKSLSMEEAGAPANCDLLKKCPQKGKQVIRNCLQINKYLCMNMHITYRYIMVRSNKRKIKKNRSLLPISGLLASYLLILCPCGEEQKSGPPFTPVLSIQ